MKRIISFLLSLAMLFSCITVVSYAGEKNTKSRCGVFEPKITFSDNQLFEASPPQENGQFGIATFSLSDEGTFLGTSETEVLRYFAFALANRNENISFYYKTSNSDFDSNGFLEELFNKVNKDEYAFSVNTGNYLYSSYINITAYGGYVEKYDAFLFQFEVSDYVTSREQEMFVDRRISEIINSLDLEAKSDYDKIKAIHDYICNITVYDYHTDEKIVYNDYTSFSPYGILANGTGVCMAYSLLFSRICNEIGIKNDFIPSDDLGNHAWNIVKLGNYYYNVDLTWDDDPEGENTISYDFFLVSNDTLKYWDEQTSSYINDGIYNHNRDSYYSTADYNSCRRMALSDYKLTSSCAHNNLAFVQRVAPTCYSQGYDVYRCSDCKAECFNNKTQKLEHDYSYFVTQPTCITNGYTTGVCSNCYYEQQINEIPKSGHSFVLTNVYSPTCTQQGFSLYYCSVCGERVTSDFTLPQHSFSGQFCTSCGAVNPNYIPPVQTASQAETQSSVLQDKKIAKPKKSSVKKLLGGKKSFKITYSKVTGVSGYQVQYSTSKKFTKKTTKTKSYSGNKKFTKTVSNLKASKKYYVRVRTYKTKKVNGKTVKVYSDWSKAKTVTTKK